MAWLTGWFSRIFKLIVQKTNRRGGAAKASIHEPFILNYECEQKIGIVTGGGDCPGLNAVIGAVVAAEPGRRSGKEARCCVLGHLQRGGTPMNFDGCCARCLALTRWN